MNYSYELGTNMDENLNTLRGDKSYHRKILKSMIPLYKAQAKLKYNRKCTHRQQKVFKQLKSWCLLFLKLYIRIVFYACIYDIFHIHKIK